MPLTKTNGVQSAAFGHALSAFVSELHQAKAIPGMDAKRL